MGTLGEINILLKAQSEEFSAGMKRACQDTDALNEHLNGLKAQFGELREMGEGMMGIAEPFLAIAGIGAAGFGVGELVHHTLEAAEANVHLAQTLGISTQELGKLQYSANLAGVGTEEVTAGMSHMSRALYEAHDGSSKAAHALDQLGLNTAALMGLNPDAAFARVAGAIGAVESPMARLAIAQEIFGHGCASIMPLILRGKEALEEEGEAAEKTGYAMNQVDAKRLAGVNEEMKKLGMEVEGAGNKLMATLAPALEGLMHAVEYFLAKGPGFLDFLVNVATLGGLSDTNLDNLLGKRADIDRVEVVRSKLDAVRDKAQEQADAMQKQAQAAKEVHDNAARAAAALQSMQDAITTFGMSEGQKKFFDLMRANPGASAAQIDEAQAMARKLDALKEEKQLQDDLAKAEAQRQAEAARQAAQAQAKLTEEVKKMWEETRTPLEKYNEEMSHLNDLMAKQAIDADVYGREQKRYQDELDKATEVKEQHQHERSRNAGAEVVSAAYTISGGTEDPMREVLDVNKQQLTDQQKQTKHIEDLTNAVVGNAVTVMSF